MTANAGVVVDNFTLDGTTLALSSGNLTIDSVAGDIILDAHGHDYILKTATSAELAVLGDNTSGDFFIRVGSQDKDMSFMGNDGGAAITALTLDMSDAGAATFNTGATFGGNVSFPDGAANLPSVTNNGDTNTGMYFPSSDRLGFSTAGVERLVLNAGHMGMETDGAYFQVAGSSNNFWAIGSTGGNNAPGTASTTLGFHHYNGSAWNNEVEFDASGNITLDGNLVVASGKGIDFSASQGGGVTTSLLNNYETGTWTPAFQGSTSNPTVGYAAQNGVYQIIGDYITVYYKLQVSSISGGGGNLLVGGLPVVGHDDTDETNGPISLVLGLGNQTGFSCGQNDGGGTFLIINKNNTNGAHTVADVSGGTYLRGMVSYRIA